MKEKFLYFFTNEKSKHFFLPCLSKTKDLYYQLEVEKNIKSKFKSESTREIIEKSLQILSNVDLMIKTNYSPYSNLKHFFFPYSVVYEYSNDYNIDDFFKKDFTIKNYAFRDNFWIISCSLNSFVFLMNEIKKKYHFKIRFEKKFNEIIEDYVLNKVSITYENNKIKVKPEDKKPLDKIIEEVYFFYEKYDINLDSEINNINFYKYIKEEYEKEMKNKFFIHNIHHDCIIFNKIRNQNLMKKFKTVFVFDIRTDFDKNLEQKIKKAFNTFFKKNEKLYFSFVTGAFTKTVCYFLTKDKESFSKEIEHIFSLYDIKNTYELNTKDTIKEKFLSYFNIMDMKYFDHYQKIFF